jgi:NAD(P)H-flavin reductase
MQSFERLPEEVVSFITNADTVFIASIYKSDGSTAENYPSHAGMNARGGLPGFVRVSPTDGRTVILPDYSGNRFLSSLGNIECSKVAGLTVVSFETGDILYLTGTAQVLVGPPALKVMAKQASITTIQVTGYILVRNSFPMRQEPGVAVERSPYSPKIKYLLEEPEALTATSGEHKARLISAAQFAPDIAIFRFRVASKPGATSLRIRPGQAVVLDFMDWIGPPVYRHMADESPSSINDDRVRTWTVSSSHEDIQATWFELTMREMKGGAVTGALFKLLSEQENDNNKLEHKFQMEKDNVAAEIVGITGDFYIGQGEVKMLWVAGGIGVTPFMAMFGAMAERGLSARGDIILALATREPDVFLKLLRTSLHRELPQVSVKIDLFTTESHFCISEFEKLNVTIIPHKGRIQSDYWIDIGKDRDILICGPGEFGDTAVDGLRKAGVPNARIHREGFY